MDFSLSLSLFTARIKSLGQIESVVFFSVCGFVLIDTVYTVVCTAKIRSEEDSIEWRTFAQVHGMVQCASVNINILYRLYILCALTSPSAESRQMQWGSHEFFFCFSSIFFTSFEACFVRSIVLFVHSSVSLGVFIFRRVAQDHTYNFYK